MFFTHASARDMKETQVVSYVLSTKETLLLLNEVVKKNATYHTAISFMYSEYLCDKVLCYALVLGFFDKSYVLPGCS